jgi:hypothetical protein
MPLLINPLPLALAEMGVTARQFDRVSPAHGTGHVNRVIFLGLLLARTHGYEDLFSAIFASAHLHDLARRHDGPCSEHGQWAIAAKLPQYLPLYRRAGLLPALLPHVITAVAAHCHPSELPDHHPHWRLCALLKDADGLDRARFGPGALARRLLRLDKSDRFITLAETLAQRTGPDADFQSVWDAGIVLANPTRGVRRVAVDHWFAHETPAQRRDRRLKQAQRPWFTQVRADIWAPDITAHEAIDTIVAELRGRVPNYEHLRSVTYRETTSAITAARAYIRAAAPTTYTNAFEAFVADGEYRTIWESGVSWQKRYHDAPEDVRALQDMRMFGELGRHVAYASMLPVNDVETNLTMSRMYGAQRIVWNRAILKGASMCPNDSHYAPFLLPYSDHNMVKLIVGTIARHLPHLHLLRPWGDAPHRYVELQIHQRLTPADMANPDALVEDRIPDAEGVLC